MLKMEFVIQVNAPPYQRQGCASALAFARAAIARGHVVSRVFFYNDGVNIATRLATPPRDEVDLCAQWQALALDHELDLVICVAAAERRGIVDTTQQQRHGLDGDNLARGFRIAGLGQLLEAVLDADRLVVFGA